MTRRPVFTTRTIDRATSVIGIKCCRRRDARALPVLLKRSLRRWRQIESLHTRTVATAPIHRRAGTTGRHEGPFRRQVAMIGLARTNCGGFHPRTVFQIPDIGENYQGDTCTNTPRQYRQVGDPLPRRACLRRSKVPNRALHPHSRHQTHRNEDRHGQSRLQHPTIYLPGADQRHMKRTA